MFEARVGGQRVPYEESLRTMEDVMDATGIPASRYASVTVTGDGDEAEIDEDELGDAVLSLDEAGLHVTVGDTDVVASGDMAVALVTDDASQLELDVFANPSRPEAGERVVFTANVAGRSSSEAPAVTWNINGEAKTGQNVGVTFDKPGTYQATATAGALEETISVTVTRAEPDPTPQPDATQAPSTGGTGGFGTGTGTGGVPGGTGTGTDPATPDATPTPTPAPSATPTPFGRRVEGELLSSPFAAAAPPPAGPDAGSTQAPGASDGVALEIPGWVPGGLLLLAVGYVGFLVDMRRARPRWST